MIGQYLSNTNENAIISILQKVLELNKAQGPQTDPMSGGLKQGRSGSYNNHALKHSRAI